MSKDFHGWNDIKIEMDGLHKPPYFKEREIWWCSIGVNIGFEVYGKDSKFTRPVLILKKYSKYTFFGLPLTSRRKEISAHFPLDFKGKEGSIILDQGRAFDSRRLHKLMGYLGKKRFQKIHQSFFEYNSQ